MLDFRRLTSKIYHENTGESRKETDKAKHIGKWRKQMLSLSKRPKAKRKINIHTQEAKLDEIKMAFLQKGRK